MNIGTATQSHGPKGLKWLSSWHRWGPIVPLLLLIGYLTLTPVGMLIWTSFKPTGFIADSGLSITHYIDVLGDPGTYRLLWRSASFAVPSSVIAVSVGTALAWLVHRTDMPTRRLLGATLILPLGVPTALLAMAWVLLLSPRIGILNTLWTDALGASEPLFDIFSLPGMIAVESIALIPTAYFILSPAVRNIDPNMEEAGLVSGAKPAYVVMRIVIPLLRPTIIASSIFLIIVGFVVFDVPGVIGMPVGIFVVSTDLYLKIQSPYALPDYGYAAALSGVFVFLLFGLGYLYYRALRNNRQYVTVTGKSSQRRTFTLGRWRFPIAVMAWAYIGVGLVLPLGILAWSSLTPYFSGLALDELDQITLRNYQILFDNPNALSAGFHSLLIAVLAATAVAILAPLVSWVVLRSQVSRRARRFFDFVAFLPVAIPGTIIGVALVVFYLNVQLLPVYGTVWIICIAYVTVFMSFATRVSNGVMLQLSPEFEEAAQASGARWTRTFTGITFPLMKPALIFVWVWVAAQSLRELSAALMLQGLDNATFPTLLWDYWRLGQPTVAAAAGVLLLFTLIPLGLIMRRTNENR